MKIRKMEISDYDSVYSLWMSCQGMGLNNIDDAEEGIERFLKRNPDTCFVAEENGRIAGIILAGNDGRRGYIYHTAVSPSARRKGIGSQLVRAALDALKNLGIIKAALVTFSRNEDVYKRQTFCSMCRIFRTRKMPESSCPFRLIVLYIIFVRE